MIFPQSKVYAIESLAYLSTKESGKATKTKELAEALNIPPFYLGKVLTELVKLKLVSSAKGPRGGFSLLPEVRTYSLYEILKIINALSILEESCVMGLGTCSDNSACALHELWRKFREQAISKTQGLTLSDMTKVIQDKHIIG